MNTRKKKRDRLWNLMLLSYRNTRFWEDFRAKYWQPRIPTVIRQPFKKFPFSEGLLLEAMGNVEADLQSGDKRKDVMVSVGDVLTNPRRPLRKLFREKNRSLDELEKNAGKVFAKKNFGLIVTNIHASHPDLWSGVASFIQDARHSIEFPVARSFMDLFYGRYESSFTALHKDTQDIIAFVVKGKKRMLAWPFDYLAERVDGINKMDRFFNKRLDHINHRKFRKDAIVLDADAGDIIYWPGDHWHVAEPVSKKFSGMMSLGILRPEVTAPTSEPSKFHERLLRPGPEAGIASQDMSDVLSFESADRALRWVTGFGFEIGGHRREPSRPRKKELTLVKRPSSVILWHVSQNELLVASGGHSITLPSSPEVVDLLKRLSQGETLRVTKNVSNEVEAKVSETYWSKDVRAKMRRLSGKRDMVACLGDWLMRVGAVEP